MPPENRQTILSADRADALLAALRQSRPGDMQALLARHPSHEVLLQRAATSSVDLAQLMFKELARLEEQWLPEALVPIDPGLSSAAYWLHRQQLTQVLRKRHQIGHLPRLWQALATLSAADVRQVTEDLGLDTIACLGADLSESILGTLLKALDHHQERRVIESIAFGSEIHPTRQARELLLGFYTMLAQHSRGPSLARRYGRIIMAMCFRAISRQDVQILATCANTNLVEALADATLPAKIDAPVLEAADLLLRRRVRIYIAERDQPSGDAK